MTLSKYISEWYGLKLSFLGNYLATKQQKSGKSNNIPIKQIIANLALSEYYDLISDCSASSMRINSNAPVALS